MQHYRLYLGALERGELETAADEARAALAASEARDGDGGRTGVLALNFATVSLMARRADQALPAAQRALTLARAGAEGVDRLFAELVVARAELASATGSRAEREAAARLNAALTAQGAEMLSANELYVAGAQLGNWGLGHRNYEMARTAWSIAGAHAEGAPFGQAYGLGRARTNEAIAIIFDELSHPWRPIDEDEAETAHALLNEAVRVLAPLAALEAPGLELTLAQQTSAEARAWFAALDSKMSADGRELLELPAEAQGDADGMSEIGPIDLSRPRCMMRMVARPLPRYPDTSQVAAVVVYFRIGPNGEILAHQVAARAGASEFADAIESVVDQWSVERLENSAPNCRMEAGILLTIRFRLAD